MALHRQKGGITQTWPGQSMQICLGREPVWMNNVHMSKRGYNIDKQECDMECVQYIQHVGTKLGA